VIELICGRMLHPQHGTGIAQFSLGWDPLGAILFKNVWGSDRDADSADTQEDAAGARARAAAEEQARPLDNTSFGHNVELGWLLRHSVRVLALPSERYEPLVRKLYAHCCAHGVDTARGGVFCEGPHGCGPARERNKEFWQQAEVLVAMLDGVQALSPSAGGAECEAAFFNVHDFTMRHVINHEVGEWLPLLSEENAVLWRYMGHAWKINYHTVRAALECEKRLADLCSKLG
jgi:mannobiose 2-epimerase